MTTAFAILGPLLKERMLTETLRYLLDSNESHGLGDAFLRSIANRLDWHLPDVHLNVTAVSEWGTDEGREVDVVAIVRTAWNVAPAMVIGIEAKVEAKESNKQIADYQTALKVAFPDVERKLIFLTRFGHVPISADRRLNAACPVTPLAWSDIAAAANRIPDGPSVMIDFVGHLTRIGNLPEQTAQAALSLVEEDILPRIQRILNFKERDVRLAWRYPKLTPREFNIDFACLNSKLPNDRVRFLYMLYSPSGIFVPGRQVHQLLMAYDGGKGFESQDEAKLKHLKQRLPPREGATYEWGPWRFLWSGGCRTLIDVGEQDAKALSEMVARAYERTATSLQVSIEALWGGD